MWCWAAVAAVLLNLNNPGWDANRRAIGDCPTSQFSTAKVGLVGVPISVVVNGFYNDGDCEIGFQKFEIVLASDLHACTLDGQENSRLGRNWYSSDFWPMHCLTSNIFDEDRARMPNMKGCTQAEILYMHRPSDETRPIRFGLIQWGPKGFVVLDQIMFGGLPKNWLLGSIEEGSRLFIGGISPSQCCNIIEVGLFRGMSRVQHRYKKNAALDEKQKGGNDSSDNGSKIDIKFPPLSSEHKAVYSVIASLLSAGFFALGIKIVSNALKRTDYLVTVGLLLGVFPFALSLILLFSVVWVLA